MARINNTSTYNNADEHSISSNTTTKKRTQVKVACSNCKAACKKCATQRPCPRCVKKGLEGSCLDSVRKSRPKGLRRGPYRKTNFSQEKTTDEINNEPKASIKLPSVSDLLTNISLNKPSEKPFIDINLSQVEFNSNSLSPTSSTSFKGLRSNPLDSPASTTASFKTLPSSLRSNSLPPISDILNQDLPYDSFELINNNLNSRFIRLPKISSRTCFQSKPMDLVAYKVSF